MSPPQRSCLSAGDGAGGGPKRVGHKHAAADEICANFLAQCARNRGIPPSSPMSFLSCCGNAFTRSACSVEIPMSGAPHTPTGLRSRAPLTPTTPSTPSSKPPLAPTECKWTIWGEPSITLAHVHAVAFYMHPPDTPVHPGWVAKLSAIMAQNKSFHEKEFPGSLMTWSLHGPIKLHRGVPYTLEGEIASNCAYDLCRTTVEALGRTAGALPPPIAHDAPWLPGGVSSSTSSTALALPTFPTVLVHPVFLDYGCEDVTGEEGQKKLHKYYVWKAASGLAEAAGIDTGAYLTSMGVTRAGGSRASYSGARAVESFPGIWASLGLLPAAGSGGGGGRVATINGPLEHVKHTPSLAPISWGVGVVTQEAWVAPDVPGSSIVAWHEGLGHSLNLPHPSYRDDTCVMSHAQYAGIPLQTACVCEELKGGMENPLTVGAGAGTQATEVISLPGVGKISTLQVKNGAVKVRTVSLTRPSGGGGGGGGGGVLGVKEVVQGALALFAALECGKGGGGGGDLGKRGVSLGWVFDFVEGGGETSSTSASASAASTPLPQKVTLLRRVEGLHPTPNSLCLSSKEPMVPPFPPTLPKPQSTTTFAAGVGEVTLSIPLPPTHPSSPSSTPAQGSFPLSLLGPRAGSDERASAIESLRLLCNDIVTAAVAESDSAIRRKMMSSSSSSSSSSSIQDGEVVLDEGGAWVETVLTLIPSSSSAAAGVVGGEGGEVFCCTYSASDAYHFKEVWSGFVVGEGGSIPTSLGVFASHFSPSSLSSWWIPSGVEVWANAHPALFPSIYIPSLGGDSEVLSPPNSGGGGGASVTPQKAARTLIWEEDERTSSTRLHLLLNDKSRDITLALPLLSSSSSLISSSGPLGRDGYRPFVKGGYVAVW